MFIQMIVDTRQEGLHTASNFLLCFLKINLKIVTRGLTDQWQWPVHVAVANHVLSQLAAVVPFGSCRIFVNKKFLIDKAGFSLAKDNQKK